MTARCLAPHRQRSAIWKQWKIKRCLKAIRPEVQFVSVFRCPVRWESMSPVGGGNEVRHCRECEEDVYDLQDASASEVEDLLRRHGGEVCAQVSVLPDNLVVLGRCDNAEKPASRGRIQAR